MSLLEQLNTQGFIVIPNAINPNKALRHIAGTEVFYDGIESFITNDMLNVLKAKLKWDPRWTKYRLSNNNNSVDASAFHRDIICQRPEHPIIPCFTFLSYLDPAVMEIIPGTHNKRHMSNTEALTSLYTSIELKLEPGDLLLFYSTILHRGIFKRPQENRRLLQIFDLYPYHHDYNIYRNQIMNVKGDDKYAKFMIKASSNKLFMPIINYIGYINAATGYGIMKNHDALYLSSEGLCHRLTRQPGTWQPINKYILSEPQRTLPDHRKPEFDWVCYNETTYAIAIATFAVLLILITIVLNVV